VSNEQVEKVARALANAVGARNGAPYIVNPLALMKPEMRERFEDDARAAIAAYEQSRCLPIESAPKDGTLMLLSDGGEPVQGSWRSTHSHPDRPRRPRKSGHEDQEYLLPTRWPDSKGGK